MCQGGASGAYGASSSSGSWSGGGLTVVPPTPQQGEYEIVDEAQSGWDVTFDFDHSRTFTIYKDAGPIQRIQYRPGGASVYVTNLVDKDSIFDGEYERQASGDFIAYIPGVGERKLPPYIMAGLRIVLDKSVAGPGDYIPLHLAGAERRDDVELHPAQNAAAAAD